MHTYDFTPLFRTSIGFDRMSRMLEHAAQAQEKSYPPYNIVKTGEDTYRITIAVAGFSLDDLEIVVHQNVLTVKGAQQSVEDESVEFLHRGIAGRSFERRFNLASHIQVQGAQTDNGLLHIDLREVVPEALKPRTIEIRRPGAVLETHTAK
jgi:molecular chaperone IbpA